MICEDTYRSCLAAVAPRENAARIKRDGRLPPNVGCARELTGNVEPLTLDMLRTLSEGPMATDDLAERHGITNKSSGERVRGMMHLGWVDKVGQVPRKKSGGRLVNVWGITDKGRERINA